MGQSVIFIAGGYSINDKIYDELLEKYDLKSFCTLVDGKNISFEGCKKYISKVIDSTSYCIGCAIENTKGFTFGKNKDAKDIRQILGNVCREKGKRVFIFNKKLPILCKVDVNSSIIENDLYKEDINIIFSNFDYYHPENMDFEYTFKGKDTNLFFHKESTYSLFCEQNIKYGKISYKICKHDYFNTCKDLRLSYQNKCQELRCE